MSDDKNNINLSPLNAEIKVDVSESTNHIIKNLFGGFSKEVGKALEYCAYRFFRTKNIKTEKLKIDEKYELESYEDQYRITDYEYKKDFIDEFANAKESIPHDDLCEPDLNIFNEILNEAEQKIEIRHLRHMYAKLLADSMNNKKSNNIHPSYIRILSQLTSTDIGNLQLIKDNVKLPIVSYRPTIFSVHMPPLKNVFLSNPKVTDLEEQLVSIDVLTRLAFIDIDYSCYLDDEKAYNEFLDYYPYISLKSSPVVDEIKIIKGIIKLSVSGNQFVSMLS